MSRQKIAIKTELSIEDLLLLENIRALTNILYLTTEFGFGLLHGQGMQYLEDIESLLDRLDIKPASGMSEDITKEFLEAGAKLLDKLVDRKGYGSNRAINGAIGLARCLRAISGNYC